MTKDSDFVDLVSRYGSPPQLIYVTCGNVTNRELQAVFSKTFPSILELLVDGQRIVEIGN